MSNTFSLPKGLFRLVVLPTYFFKGIGICLDEEERERNQLAPFDGDMKKRWLDEFVPYREHLTIYAFSGDVAGFKAFAAQNQNYFGKDYYRVREMPVDICLRLLQEIAEERINFKVEQMTSLFPVRQRYEA